MDYLQALIFAVIEGVTEFLPVSSTGHLVLASSLLNIEQTAFIKSFEIFIQLGAIVAVIVLFWRKLMQGREVWIRVFIAFLPTAIVGFLLYKIIKDILLGNNFITVLALFIGGILLILIELMHKEKDTFTSSIEQLNLKNAFLIGLAQSLSVIPGVSRSAASIIGAMLLKTKRKTAVEFSFLLAIPTMLAATSYDLIKSDLKFTQQEIGILTVGFIGSFVVALVVVRWFLAFVQKNNFIYFGIYRILVALIFYLTYIR